MARLLIMESIPKVLIIMGVSGCGKTTVGLELASALNWQFKDADDFHPPENKEKMRAGEALCDSDRYPWLNLLKSEILSWIESDNRTVLACSSLKASYRALLGEELPEVKFVYLKGEKKVLEQRLSTRVHEYMNPNLLDSQFETLEEPNLAIVVDASASVESIVASIKTKLETAV